MAGDDAPLVPARDSIRRIVAALVVDELRELRGPDAAVPAAAELAADDVDLDRTPTLADSLERLGLVARVNEYFHLHESGLEDVLLQNRQVGAWCEVIERSRAAAGDRITVRTSGSTGVPRPVTKSAAELRREVNHWAAFLADGPGTPRRIVAQVPPHHIYGLLWTVLLPQRLGVPVVDRTDASPDAVVRRVEAGDLIVSHPWAWRLVDRLGARWSVPAVGVTATGPLEGAVVTRLVDRGLASMIEVYGASEAGAMGVRRDPTAPYELLPWWHRDDAGGGVRSADAPDTPPFALDRLEWASDGRFRVGERLDGAVQVGGTNVFPARIAAAIAGHPRVAACSVDLVGPDGGARLRARVTPLEEVATVDGGSGPHEAGDLAADLRAWIEARLAPAERPRTIELTGG